MKLISGASNDLQIIIKVTIVKIKIKHASHFDILPFKLARENTTKTKQVLFLIFNLKTQQITSFLKFHMKNVQTVYTLREHNNSSTPWTLFCKITNKWVTKGMMLFSKITNEWFTKGMICPSMKNKAGIYKN